MQWMGKKASAGHQEKIFVHTSFWISVIDPPVPINQQFFGLCKKDFEDINSSFM